MADSTHADEPSFKPQVNLLPDDPTEDDRTGGGHRRVARAIADVVAEPNGGKAIALEGTWGSGKSSVMRMLPSECKGPAFVFEFDAWKHERDPLRVTFLNELTKALKRDGWINQDTAEDLEQTFDEISGKVKREQKTESALFRARDLALIATVFVLLPILLDERVRAAVGSVARLRQLLEEAPVYWGAVAILTAVVMACIQRLASSALLFLADRSRRWRRGPQLQLWAGVTAATLSLWGLTGSFSPDFVYSLLLSCMLFGRGAFLLLLSTPDPREHWFWKQEKSLRERLRRLRHTLKSPSAFLQRLGNTTKSPSFVEHLLRRQPNEIETTVRGRRHLDIEEFEKYFVRIVRAASDGAEVPDATRDKFRFVIVLDNLDRLEPENAMAVWATVQAFIELGKPASGLDEDDKALIRHAWLIVPYDRARLLPAVAQAGRSEHSDRAQTETGGDTDKEEAGLLKNYPSSFLDKSFVVRFEVPPLSSTGWKRHLWECLHDALPDLVGEATDGPLPEVVESIARLGTRASVIRQHPPSARSVIHFVNDIGALVRQHGERLEGYAQDDPDADVNFTLESLAAYALLRRWPRNAEAIRNELLRGPDAEIEPLPRGWQRHENGERLACLVFNTHKVSVAMELLLADSIGPALCKTHGKDLAALLEHKVFWQVLQQSSERVQAYLQARQGQGLVRTAINIDAVLEGQSSGTKRNATEMMRDLIQAIDGLHVGDDLPHALAAMIRLVPEMHTFELLNSRLRTAVSNTRNPDAALVLARATCSLWGEARCCRVVRISEQHGPEVDVRVGVPPERSELAPFLSELFADRENTAWIWGQLASSEADKLLGALAPTDDTKEWTLAQYEALYVARHSSLLDGIKEQAAANLRNWAFGRGIDQPESLQLVLAALRSDELSYQQASSHSKDLYDSTVEAFRKIATEQRTLEKHYDRLMALFVNGNWREVAPLFLWHGISHELLQFPFNHNHLHAVKDAIGKWLDGGQLPPDLGTGLTLAPDQSLRLFMQKRIARQDGCHLAQVILRTLNEQRLARVLPASFVVENYEAIYSCVCEEAGLIDTIVSAAIKFGSDDLKAVEDLQKKYPWMDPHERYWDERGQ